LGHDDAKELVAAGRNYDAVLAVLNRNSPNPAWAKTLGKLILDHNERFRKEVEAKNGPAGVQIEVWGLRRREDDVVTGLEWFESDIERAILPERWQQLREQGRAASTLAVYWTVKPR
jgi:hypothetical protein